MASWAIVDFTEESQGTGLNQIAAAGRGGRARAGKPASRGRAPSSFGPIWLA